MPWSVEVRVVLDVGDVVLLSMVTGSFNLILRLMLYRYYDRCIDIDAGKVFGPIETLSSLNDENQLDYIVINSMPEK